MMQAISSSLSSSSSSSQQPADGRPDPSAGMDELQRLHLHSPPPPPPDHIKGMEELRRLHLCSPPPPPGKDRKKLHHPHGHHGAHSPPPHHRHHSAHKLRHRSPPPAPICAMKGKLRVKHPKHSKKDKLRVKHPKHCKKVRKLHRKLMKACKHLKGTAHHDMLHLCPDAGLAMALHHPGCCLHNRDLSMMNDEMLAELDQHPPCLEGRGGHHGHRHPHPHGRHSPRVRSEVRRRSPPPMSPRHEAIDMEAEPASEAVVPTSNRLLLTDE